MRRFRMNPPGRATAKTIQTGSLESDRDRDIADWEAMLKVAFVYVPLLALAPVMASAIYFLMG